MVHSKLFRTIVAATVIATSTLQTLAAHAAGPTEPMGPIGPAAPNRVYGGGDGGTLELGTWCIEESLTLLMTVGAGAIAPAA